MTNKKSDPSTWVMSYLVLAQSDYLAGRHLLRNDYLEQGAMLAATAAEKYLKAVISVGGMNNSEHLSGTLFAIDMLVADIDRCFVVAETPYRTSVERAAPRVLEENVAISPALLPTLIPRPNRVLNYKVEDDHQTVYATYSTEGVNMAGPFMKWPKITLTKNTFTVARG